MYTHVSDVVFEHCSLSFYIEYCAIQGTQCCVLELSMLACLLNALGTIFECRI